MVGLIGADVAGLRATAKAFDACAQQLTSIRTGLGAQLSRTPWTGPDAARFRTSWENEHGARLSQVETLLADAADALRRNAQEQEDASSEAGAASAVGSSAVPLGGSADHPPAGSSAAEVTDWWNSLNAAQQHAFVTDHPQQAGLLDGLPGAVRDAANRAWLTQQLADIDGREPEKYTGRSGVPTTEWKEWNDEKQSLENVRDMLAADSGLSLLLLDTREGRVEVALARGDVDHADNVGVYTQGLFSNTADAGLMRDQMGKVDDLRDTARDVLVGAGRGDESVAMVMWMGYDSPQDVITVLGRGPAEAGAPALASFADGLHSVNADARLSALGHSYGSVVTGIAAQQTSAFDAIAAFGSPGLGTSDIHDLKVPAGGVYALGNRDDLVASSGAFGTRPTDMDGVTALSTRAQQGMTEADDGFLGGWTWLADIVAPPLGIAASVDQLLDQHNGYLIENSTAEHNLAAVVVGEQDAMLR